MDVKKIVFLCLAVLPSVYGDTKKYTLKNCLHKTAVTRIQDIVLRSPNHPDPMPPSSRCRWTFTKNIAEPSEFYIHALDIDIQFDNCTSYVALNQFKICGKERGRGWLSPLTNLAEINLIIGPENTKSKFKVLVMSVKAEPLVIPLVMVWINQPAVYVSPPTYGKIPKQITWLIKDGVQDFYVESYTSRSNSCIVYDVTWDKKQCAKHTICAPLKKSDVGYISHGDTMTISVKPDKLTDFKLRFETIEEGNQSVEFTLNFPAPITTEQFNKTLGPAIKELCVRKINQFCKRQPSQCCCRADASKSTTDDFVNAADIHFISNLFTITGSRLTIGLYVTPSNECERARTSTKETRLRLRKDPLLKAMSDWSDVISLVTPASTTGTTQQSVTKPTQQDVTGTPKQSVTAPGRENSSFRVGANLHMTILILMGLSILR